MEFPQSIPVPVFDRTGKYIGHGLHDTEWLMVNDDYEITLDDVEEIINLSDPCKPESYYQVIR